MRKLLVLFALMVGYNAYAREGEAYLPSFQARLQYGVTTVTSSAWTQLVDHLPQSVNYIETFDSGGFTMQLATGEPGSEHIFMLLFPGGNGPMPLFLPQRARISIKALGATTVNSGENDINFYQ